jgi:hypothetical protein
MNQSEMHTKKGTKVYQLFCKKWDEFFFVASALKDVKGNVTFPGKSREDRILLSLDEDLPTLQPSPFDIDWLGC